MRTPRAVFVMLIIPLYLLALVGCGALGGKEFQPAATPAPDGPEAFIRGYFDALVSERDYKRLWTLATDAFNEANYASDYQLFVEYWDSVESLDLVAVSVKEQNASSALCDVNMTITIGGSAIPAEVNYHIVHDGDKGSWVFDSP